MMEGEKKKRIGLEDYNLGGNCSALLYALELNEGLTYQAERKLRVYVGCKK
jgi:hypothetical protein